MKGEFMKSVTLIENFRSFQGEGPDMGRAMFILRFRTCNLKCPWCDTAVKMRISAEAPYLLSEIQDKINETNCGLLITGGEPTVPKHFNETLALLNELDYPIANVESNGYNLEELIKNTDRSKNVKFMYSPKVFSLRNDVPEAIKKTKSLLNYKNVYIKLVYENNNAIEAYIKKLSEMLSKDLYASRRVWLMPEGTSRAVLIKNAEQVFDAAEKYKFNFSSRSHIIYGFV